MPHPATQALIKKLIRSIRPKAKSAVITIYGDAIVHHGGATSLGSLIRLAGALGIADRAVRTSVFRLTREQWLAPEQIGRRSFYRLTETGRRRFDAAYSRIYFHDARPWDGHWTVVMTQFAKLTPARRKVLGRELGWQGFGQLASGLFIHPSPNDGALRQIMTDTPGGPAIAVMRAAAVPWAADRALRDVINHCWDMKSLAAEYNAFLTAFRPVWQAFSASDLGDPEQCFVVRTLLMHAYRRVLLRDPNLPDELLAADWPGTSARLLCRNLYRLVETKAEDHAMAMLETADGAPPPAHPRYFTRFGGLARRVTP